MSRPNAEPESLKRVRLMLLEPFGEIGAAMTSMLRSEGLTQTEHVHTLDAARAKIRTHVWDALLLEADGVEAEIERLVRDLRAGRLGDDPFAVVIVTQSVVTTESARRFSRAGVDGILDKPYAPASVLDHLLDLAGRPRLFVVEGPYAGPEHRRNARTEGDPHHLEAPNRLAATLAGEKIDLDAMERAKAAWREASAGVFVS